MIHGTCTNGDCENHRRLVEVDPPSVGTTSSKDIAGAPGLRMDAGYHLARQAPCPKCGTRLGELDDLKVTVAAEGLSDEEIRESALKALRAGNFEISGALAID
jgi:hypothetical protein